MLRVLSLLARVGPTTIRRSELASLVSPDAEPALRAAGVLRAGPLARSYACGDPGAHDCAREVHATDDDGPCPYVAICPRRDEPCPPVELTADDLAQVGLSVDALARTLTELLALDAAARGSTPPAEPRDPRLLGTEMRDGSARDVYLAIPTAPDRLTLWLAARAHAARPATVFVATADLLSSDLFTRHAPGAHVELARLDDLLRIRDNALAIAPRLRVVRAPAPSPAPTRSAPGAPRPLPPLTSWRDLHLHYVDGLTLLARIGRSHARLTHIDLGMASKQTREPTKPFKILSAICQGDGTFRWRDFGEFEVVGRQISYLRANLCRAFGLEESPFETFTYDAAWRPKFRAHANPPGEDDDA